MSRELTPQETAERSLIKKYRKELWNPFIAAAKRYELIVPGDFAKQASDPVGKVAARVYERLQQRLKAANAFDFDDLLLYAYLLLKHHEENHKQKGF